MPSDEYKTLDSKMATVWFMTVVSFFAMLFWVMSIDKRLERIEKAVPTHAQ
jgi:hypothetical protein